RPPPGTLAVLNLCETDDRYPVRVYEWAPIEDAAPAPTADWLRRQLKFIETQRRAGGPVFVHCPNGVSRRGMGVRADLMSETGWSRDQALEFVRTRRPTVRPHPAFMSLLQDWEEIVKQRHADPSSEQIGENDPVDEYNRQGDPER